MVLHITDVRLATLGGLAEILNECLEQGFPPQTRVGIFGDGLESDIPIDEIIADNDGITIYLY